jgi:lysophospholipase L1-like esterase
VSTRTRKILLLALGSSAVALLLAAIAVEAWVRLTWDPRRGAPGFFLSDPARGQRLAPGYDGWFAGVPVRINSLGFRDTREYSLDKRPGTFRILVFGDSVTFGHGATFETTYPYLLEQRLKEWRPDVLWEVWNLGVPGYNTRQELTYLREVGPRYDPDLVVIGFYPNDFTGNEDQAAPGRARRAASAVLRVLQRHVYSLEFYKRAYLTARWILSKDEDYQRRLEHLQTESELAIPLNSLADAPQQSPTPVDYFDDDDVRQFVCIGVPQIDATKPGELSDRIRVNASEITPWLDAVRDLQQLARDGLYRIVFFINMAPETCTGQDRFYNAGSLADDRVLLEVLGDGTPAVSSARPFLHYRPSQMPLAAGHSLGNANVVKADVLFAFLRERVLPPVVGNTARDGQD